MTMKKKYNTSFIVTRHGRATVILQKNIMGKNDIAAAFENNASMKKNIEIKRKKLLFLRVYLTYVIKAIREKKVKRVSFLADIQAMDSLWSGCTVKNNAEIAAVIG